MMFVCTVQGLANDGTPIVLRWYQSQNASALFTTSIGSLDDTGQVLSTITPPFPAEMFQAVGPFREELFLDYADIEWSLRARFLG